MPESTIICVSHEDANDDDDAAWAEHGFVAVVGPRAQSSSQIQRLSVQRWQLKLKEAHTG